jgi:hypothetical protein
MVAIVSTLEGITDAGYKILKEGRKVFPTIFPDVKVEWWSSTSGKLGVVRIVWWHASLAAKEAFDERFFSNPTVQKVFSDNPGPYWASQHDDYFTLDQS